MYLLEGFLEIISLVAGLHSLDETQKFSKVNVSVTIGIDIIDLVLSEQPVTKPALYPLQRSNLPCLAIRCR